MPAVAAAAIMSFLDVAASLEPAVDAAAILSSLLALSFYNSLSHDCDMRSVVFRQARQSSPVFGEHQLGEQVATCTFLHELLEARGAAGSSIGALSCPMTCPMKVSAYRRLRTRSGKNFEYLVSNTAFHEYVALFFASDSVWPRVC